MNPGRTVAEQLAFYKAQLVEANLHIQRLLTKLQRLEHLLKET